MRTRSDAPPPMMAIRGGTSASSSTWSDESTRAPSNSRPGSERGVDPVAITRFRPETSVPSDTRTRLVAASTISPVPVPPSPCARAATTRDPWSDGRPPRACAPASARGRASPPLRRLRSPTRAAPCATPRRSAAAPSRGCTRGGDRCRRPCLPPPSRCQDRRRPRRARWRSRPVLRRGPRRRVARPGRPPPRADWMRRSLVRRLVPAHSSRPACLPLGTA